MLAKQNEYIGEALTQLEVISQDEKKRMAYTARQKAIFDYNTQMEERYEAGVEDGIARLTANMRALGMTEEQIQQIITGQGSLS